MKKIIFRLEEIINTLNKRERMIVLMGVLSVFYMIWNTYLIMPIEKNQKKLSEQMIILNTQLSEIAIRNAKAGNLLKVNIKQQIKNETQSLKIKINNQENKIKAQLDNQVPSELMVLMLADILRKNNDLKLQFINNLPSEPLVKKEDNKTDNDEIKEEKKSDSARIFIHPLELELHGNYLDILKYLIEIENLEWKIFWDDIKLKVINHPEIKVNIKVHTFSLKEGWLSV